MKKIISFVFITLLSISIFSQSIPVQKNTKQGRTETLKEISFMSFDYTSKRDDVISYFNKYGVEFKVINNWKSSGSLDYETYRIEDIEYCGCTFNYIDIDIQPKDRYFQTEDKLFRIYCVPLTDSDLSKYEKYLQENYAYSVKEKLYYGKSRFPKNGENSGYIYFDEIVVDTTKKAIIYSFTVVHDYIVPVKNSADYIPFETEEEIENASMKKDGRFSSKISIPSKSGNKFMYEYCTYKDVNGIKTLYVSFKNCSTFASKLMTPQEAFDFLILDGHPFGKEKVE